MVSVPTQQVPIIRTERGLTIEGTRTSLYDIIDLLKADYPPKLIGDTFNLTKAQINAALAYIAANPGQIEGEYQDVLQTRAEIRHYWDERNAVRLAQIATTPRPPEKAALWAKLEAQKAERQGSQH
jgi:uncharacterized protein (DUF433 family)